MNDLVRWSQSQVQEARNGYGWDVVTESHDIASIVDILKGVTGHIEVLLGPNDVHLLPVVESLANKGHIHEREEGDSSGSDSVWPIKDMLTLPIEGSLAKN